MKQRRNCDLIKKDKKLIFSHTVLNCHLILGSYIFRYISNKIGQKQFKSERTHVAPNFKFA